MSNQSVEENYKKTFYMGEVTRLVLQVVLGIGLLAGGIIFLALKIAGWSIIFGLPMVVISSVFIIYTYDDVLNRHLNIHSHQEYHDEKMVDENK